VTDLRQLKTKLIATVDQVSIRGSGMGEILFAMHQGRADVVSKKDDRHWWMEFWERSDDDHASPVREVTAQSEDEVLQTLLDWLR